MIKQRKIELLAPAKNLECGIEAINHGADAVYIGAPKFGARAAAVNSLEDIEALVQYAHLYNARIYVTVNTILKEEELKETEEMIHALYRIGVDALIVQDMGITKLNLPPIPLHASTQMDNRTPEKVRFLWKAGFRQVVLARELSLREIKIFIPLVRRLLWRYLYTERFALAIAGNAMSVSPVSGVAQTGVNVHNSVVYLLAL